MAIFDKLANAAKDFFIEPEDGAAAPVTPPTAQYGATAPAATAAPMPAAASLTSAAPGAAPVAGQAEQRHLDHIAGLLAGDGKDFAAYMKMVKSMAAAGLSGSMLYQTAFNAFSAVNGGTVPVLLASATQFERALTDDREKVLARHREKMGEGSAQGPVALLVAQEKKLAADLAELTQQLQAKQQQLQQTQQQLTEERQKTQSALASYELANSAALADLQAHHRSAETFLSATK